MVGLWYSYVVPAKNPIFLQITLFCFNDFLRIFPSSSMEFSWLELEDSWIFRGNLQIKSNGNSENLHFAAIKKKHNIIYSSIVIITIKHICINFQWKTHTINKHILNIKEKILIKATRKNNYKTKTFFFIVLFPFQVNYQSLNQGVN